jgi:transposase
LGVGLSTLNKWIKTFDEEAVVSGPDQDLARENERLRRESRILKEERDVLKSRSGPSPACAWYKQLVLRSPRRAVADGLLVAPAPLKNVAHGLMRICGVVTPRTRRSRLGR